MIALDLPGHGESFRSTDSAKDYSMIGISAHVEQTVRELNPDNYILVGTSLGSNIIGEIIPRLKNCKGMLIASCSIIGKGLTPDKILQPNPNLAPLFTPNPTDAEIDLLIADMNHDINNETRNQVRTIFKNTDPQFRVHMAASIGAGAYSDEIANVENSGLPLCVVFGDKERLCFIEYLNTIELKKWGDKIHIIANAGHNFQYDQPAKFSVLLKEFADSCFTE